MYKKTIATILTATVMFGGLATSTALAEPGKDLQIIPVIVNGQKVKFPDTEPYTNTDGRTMVPVRFVSEKLGADVKWEAATETAIIKYEGKEIRMSIGSKMVSVNGETVTLDTAAEKYEGRTMVPLRFVSEVLDSKVEWDEGAHAVKVTDAEYQAKIDSGEVTLDPWGREYSKVEDDNWMRLTDLEGANFYDFYKRSTSRKFIEPKDSFVYKKTADILGNKIRSWYEVQLNVDYRTIDEDALVSAFINNASGNITKNSYKKSQAIDVIKKYVAWVKENKVIAKGYADPELSTSYVSGTVAVITTQFKFMIISAEDTAQTFLDNWDASDMSDSFELKKNVWYEGYSPVTMDSVVANSSWGEDHGLRMFENMFIKGSYFYNIQE